MNFFKCITVLMLVSAIGTIPVYGMDYVTYLPKKLYSFYQDDEAGLKAANTLAQQIKNNSCTIQTIKEHIHTILRYSSKPDLQLNSIFSQLLYNPQLIKIFTDYVLHDWKYLDGYKAGRKLFWIVRNHAINSKDMKRIKYFVDFACEQFTKFTDLELLALVLAVASYSARISTENSTIVQIAAETDVQLFLTSMLSNPKFLKTLIDFLIESRIGINKSRIIYTDSKIKEEFFSFINKFFHLLKNTTLGIHLIESYLVCFPEHKDRFLLTALENLENMNTDEELKLLNLIAKRNATDPNVVKIIEHIKKKNQIHYNNSQTEMHLLSNCLVFSNYLEYLRNFKLLPMYKKVIELEKELNNDYYTFVHGQRATYYFPEKLYTYLWAFKYKKIIPQFFFAHVADINEKPEDLTFEKIQRNFILNNGGDKELRKKVLFMNYALFGNSRNEGSNSAFYVISNQNSALGTFPLKPEHAFAKFDKQHIYKKFRKEIEDLTNKYINKSEYGNLLFVAVLKDKIHKYVYLGMSGGKK